MEGKGILVREADRGLDADVYLEEHHWWAPCGLCCQFLLQRMFLHAAATGQKEYDHTFNQGCQEALLEEDLEAEPSAIQLICPESTREETAEIYWDVYQL